MAWPPRLPALPRAFRMEPGDPRVAGAFGVVGVVLVGIAFAAFTPGGGPAGPTGPERPPPLNVTWAPVVDLGEHGYEPGLAVDSTGALYYTAHKDQTDRSTYPYLASWFLIITDDGQT